MNCPNCHTEVVAGARFCPKCGTPFGVANAAPIGQTMATAAPSISPGASLPRAKSIPPVEIAGRYRIHEKLGEGAMGAVYRAEQISLKRPVAVKLLKASLSTDKTLVRRFNAEAEAVAKLSHPNTVNIHDFGQEKDGSLFIVMELVEGITLRKAIEEAAPFSPQRSLFIAGQIAASISDAHARSIVHRDLKPDNVMLQTRGRVRDIVRVLDFGIAKLRDDTRATIAAMTQAGDMLGTPQYMAPEQVLGDAVDGRVDIYALGCIIYEMVTARRVFDATSVTEILTKHLSENVVPPSQRRPDLNIPADVDRLVMMATMKQAAARPPTMDAFGEQIAAVLASLPRDGYTSSEALPVAYAPASGAIPAVGPWATPPAGTPNVGAQLRTPPAGLPNVGPAQTPPAMSPAGRAHSPSSGMPQVAPTMPVTPAGGLPPAHRAHTPSSSGLPEANRAHTPSSQLPLYGRATPSGALPQQLTPPVGMSPAQTPASGLPPAQRAHTPSSAGLPTAQGMRTPSGPASALSSTDVGHRASSSRGLLIAVLALVVGAAIGGGVYLALRKNKQPARVATNDHPAGSATGGSATSAGGATSAGSAVTPGGTGLPTPGGTGLPTPGGSQLPQLPGGGSAASVHPGIGTHPIEGGSATAGSAAGSGDEPVVMSDDPPGQIVSAASGFKLIVPPGFSISRQGKNVYAQAKGYTIVIGPITSKLRDPEAMAKEYADQAHLTLDGVVELTIGDVNRPGAALHGKLYGDEVAVSIFNYVGLNYRVLVSLFMPYEARNDPTVRAFADELFNKRVIPPN